jgi:hypothetical protein
MNFCSWKFFVIPGSGSVHLLNTEVHGINAGTLRHNFCSQSLSNCNVSIRQVRVRNKISLLRIVRSMPQVHRVLAIAFAQSFAQLFSHNI